MYEKKAEKIVRADLCIIGGGMAGLCAAIAAARRGVKVALVQDRPVLGGNASSEIRMWIRGASNDFPEYREGGLIEEIASDNIFYNPEMNFSQWDGVLYNKVTAEKNIMLFLNSSCVGAETKGGKILSVLVWQLTTYTRFRVCAEYFADCSGDCVLAEFTDAKYRQGREARAEFGESLAPERADRQTMGNSCLLQARETDHPVAYKAPPFAYKFRDEEFENRLDIHAPIQLRCENFWWLELGGAGDALKDAEKYNRELIARAFGAWDYIKNSGRFDAAKWELDWVGFLAGKRETRRYCGDYTLTQNDIDEARVFDDEIAYGGWSMDDHNSLGLETRQPPNIYHLVKQPYSIPYRCLYSSNIPNLFFAGRNVSVTHMALSSTRVMATCAMMGQAVGTACALAKKYCTDPRGVLGHIDELKQDLREDDCFLLHTPRRVSEAMKGAVTNLAPESKELLCDGIERDTEGKRRAVVLKRGESCLFTFDKSVYCRFIRIVFDNDIAGRRYPESEWYLRRYPNRCSAPKNAPKAFFPPYLTKEYRVYVVVGGEKICVRREEENFRRLVKIPVDREIEALELVCDKTYGKEDARLFSVDII